VTNHKGKNRPCLEAVTCHPVCAKTAAASIDLRRALLHHVAGGDAILDAYRARPAPSCAGHFLGKVGKAVAAAPPIILVSPARFSLRALCDSARANILG
jgi:hypothetical protein